MHVHLDTKLWRDAFAHARTHASTHAETLRNTHGQTHAPMSTYIHTYTDTRTCAYTLIDRALVRPFVSWCGAMPCSKQGNCSHEWAVLTGNQLHQLKTKPSTRVPLLNQHSNPRPRGTIYKKKLGTKPASDTCNELNDPMRGELSLDCPIKFRYSNSHEM